MIFYFIFSIYIFFISELFIISTIIIISFFVLSIANIDASFIKSQDGENIETRYNDLWTENNNYLFINYGIIIILLIFIGNLKRYKDLLLKYLSFNLK